MKTDCRPKRLRKYQDRDDTHRTSKSRVATPDWSIDLKRMVSGKGSFTASCQHCRVKTISKLCERLSSGVCPLKNILITKPAKNAFIQPIMTVCGIIIIIFPFIIPIMPSIAAGSVIGFAGALPLFSGSLRKMPSL